MYAFRLPDEQEFNPKRHVEKILERIEEGEQQVGGIIIPDTAKEKPQQGKVIAAGKGKIKDMQDEAKAWRDIWTAGQGVGSIHDVPTVKDIVNRFQKEYSEARGHGTAVLRQKADARESMSAPTTRGRK